METISIQNIKGGVGKTTTTVHLAAGIVENDPNARVLVIDCDQQASLKHYFRLKHKDTDSDFSDFVVGGVDFRACIQKVDIDVGKQIDVMLSSKKLAEAEVRLATFPRREEAVKMRFEEQGIAENYDYVLFDCPPSLNLVTYNVLTVAQHILIPCNMDLLSLMGVKTIMENLQMINKYYKITPNVLGILPTQFDGRTSASKTILKQLKTEFGKYFPILHPIRNDTKVKNALIRKSTIFKYASDSRASEDYRLLVRDVLKKIAEPARLNSPHMAIPKPQEISIQPEVRTQ